MSYLPKSTSHESKKSGEKQALHNYTKKNVGIWNFLIVAACSIVNLHLNLLIVNIHRINILIRQQLVIFIYMQSLFVKKRPTPHNCMCVCIKMSYLFIFGTFLALNQIFFFLLSFIYFSSSLLLLCVCVYWWWCLLKSHIQQEQRPPVKVKVAHTKKISFRAFREDSRQEILHTHAQ